ncbi:MAG: hypothetical protein ABIL05_03665, partial [candidate division WOR-3 bacterium]
MKKYIITLINIFFMLSLAWPSYEWSVDTDFALEPHQANNIVRDTAGNFHVTFVSNDRVWYTMSSDLGMTWTTPFEVYAGSNSYLRAGIVANYEKKPGIIWTVPRAPQYYWPAYRYKDANGNWADPIIFNWTDRFAMQTNENSDMVSFSIGINYANDSIYVGKRHPWHLDEWTFPYGNPGPGNHRFYRLQEPFYEHNQDRICLSIDDPLNPDAYRFYIYRSYRSDVEQIWINECFLYTQNGDVYKSFYRQYSYGDPWQGEGDSIQDDHTHICAIPDPFGPGNFPWKEVGCWGMKGSERPWCEWMNRFWPPYTSNNIRLRIADSSRSPVIAITNQRRAFVTAWFNNPLSSEVYYQPECYWGMPEADFWWNLSNTPNTISDEINVAVYQTNAGPGWSPIPPETWAGLLWYEKEGNTKKVKFDLVYLPDEVIGGDQGPGGKGVVVNGKKMVIDDQGAVHAICNVVVNDSVYYVCHDAVKPKWIKAVAIGAGINSNIAICKDGTLIILYLSNDQTRVYYTQSANGKFSPPFIIAEDPDGKFISASCVIDDGDMIHFLLEKISGDRWLINYGTAPISQTPEPKWQSVNTSAILAKAGNSSLIVDPNGRVSIVYTNPSDGEIYYAMADGNNITSRQNLSESKELFSTLPVIDVYNNLIIAVWQEDNGEIYARTRSVLSGPWSLRKKVAMTSTTSANLSISKGNILYDDNGIIYLVRKVGTDWLPPAPFYNSAYYTASYPQLACLETGEDLKLYSVFTIEQNNRRQIL